MRPLSVLFLSSDDLVAQVRLLPLLDVLVASGRISYAVVDRDLRIAGHRGGSFDVCLAHRSPGKRQIRWLQDRDIALLYDIDDLLLNIKSEHEALSPDPVRWCLDHATAVTGASPRLLATLDGAMKGRLAKKAVMLPNAGRETEPPMKASSGTPKLIWISSAFARPTNELAQLCRGIAEASEKLSSRAMLVGRFPQSILDGFPRAETVPWIEPRRLFAWLDQQPLIAVAPLSANLPAAEQRFSDCKSDIKIAQYGSSGVVGVYSSAAAYVESDLPRRIVARNDAKSWADEILDAAGAFPDEGVALARHAAFARRRPSVLAAQLLVQLESAAAAGKPFTFRAIAIPRLGRLIEQGVRRWLR